jgi:hypothetical protein
VNRWDHLVDNSNEEKGKEDSHADNLMLGSRLDKGDKGRKFQEYEYNDDDEDDDEDVENGDDAVATNGKGGKEKSAVDGNVSVLSLCSDDFNFSTSTSVK